MLFAMLSILGGVALLVVGGEALVRGSVAIARSARLSPAVIGLTVVAIGTSVPELSVSLIAALENRVDIAVGNVVGSNIFNIAGILGLCAMIRPLTISGSIFRLEYPVLLLVTLLTIVLALDGWISRPEAALLITSYVAFTAYAIHVVRRGISRTESAEFEGEVAELTQHTGASGALLPWILVVVGIALLGGGAQLTVNGAVVIAKALGMSERVIGLTIVSVGTSLPEIMASVVSSFRGRDDMALGNVIGSNIFNALGILGVSGAVVPLSVHPSMLSFDMWWMLGFTLVLLPMMISQRRVSRWEGAGLLGAWCVYVGILIQTGA